MVIKIHLQALSLAFGYSLIHKNRKMQASKSKTKEISNLYPFCSCYRVERPFGGIAFSRPPQR